MKTEYQIEAEIAILSHCLYNPASIEEFSNRLASKHFSSQAHQYIWQAMVEIEQGLIAKDSAIILDLNNYLSSHGREDLLTNVYKLVKGSVFYRIHSPKDSDKAISAILEAYQRKDLGIKALALAQLVADPLASQAEIIKAYEAIQITSKEESETKRLRLEISNYLSESDGFKKIRLKKKIQSYYSLNRFDFLSLCRIVETERNTPQKTRYSAKEFFELDFGNDEWLIPGLIPLGESILFAGDAKCGKSNLVGDLIYSILANRHFLGEKTRTVKVGYGACDESLRDTQSRFRELGIDLIPDYQENLCLNTDINLENLDSLAQWLEDENPQLIIIDNLTTIARNAGVKEKDAEFAYYLYNLNRLANQYKCTFIVLHHENKDPLAEGTGTISGNARIIAAPWAIWQIKHEDKKDYRNPNRRLHIKPRAGLGRILAIAFNPRPQWSREGIFKFRFEVGDEQGDNMTQGQKIIEALKISEYEANELQEITGISKSSIYKVLDRLETRGEIKKRRSKVNPRIWVYFLSNSQQNGGYSQQDRRTDFTSTVSTPSPPPLGHTIVRSEAVIVDNKEVCQSDTNLTSDLTLSDMSDCQTTVSDSLNSHQQIDSSFNLTNTVRQGGGVVECTSEFSTPDIDSQLAFLESSFKVGDKVRGKNKNTVISNWIGYVAEISQDNCLVKWNNRQELMTFCWENIESCLEKIE